MRPTLVVGATTLSLALLVTGCGGSDDSSSPPGSSSPSSTTAPTGPGTSKQEGGTRIHNCQARVSVSGDARMDLTGAGTVRIQDLDQESTAPGAVYVAEKGGSRLSIYSAGKQFSPSVTFASGNTAFSSPASAQDQIDPTGSSAHVELTATSGNRRSVDVTADFSCADPTAHKKHTSDTPK